MGLRWKIALSLALVALIATFAVGLIGYRSTSARLVDEVDRSISQATGQMIGRAVDGRITMPTRSLLEVYSVRVLDAGGKSVASSFPDEAPIETSALLVVGAPRSVDRTADHLTGGLADRPVDLVEQACTRGPVADQSDGERRHQGDRRQRQRDLPAQAHQSSIRAV